MNIVFLGTPDFAVLPLKSIIETGKDKVVAVVCNKDKLVGRKQTLTPPPVKVLAESFGIPVLQYDKIRAEGVEDLKKLNADIFVTCAFGQILSQEILDIPRLGVINIHGSLLPKLRGASPIQQSILNGDKVTGITIMKTDIGIDSGDIIYQKEIKISENETAGELFERLSVLGAQCVVTALDLIRENKAKYVPQNESEATFCKMIKKEDAFIDWNRDAEEIINKIRAYNPWPVARTVIRGETIKIYSAIKDDGVADKAGKIFIEDKKLIISAKNGGVSVLKLQKEGGKVLDVKDFINGTKIISGDNTDG